MPSTFTPSLRLELQAAGENAAVWGDKANAVFSELEQSVAGVEPIPMLDGTTTLTLAYGDDDQSRNAVLVLTGTLTADRTLICPPVQKVYIVTNNTLGGFTVTIGAAGGAGVLVAAGNTVLLYCDGTNCKSVAASILPAAIVMPSNIATAVAQWRFNSTLGINYSEPTLTDVGVLGVNGVAGAALNFRVGGTLAGSVSTVVGGLELGAAAALTFSTVGLPRMAIATDGTVTLTNSLTAAGTVAGVKNGQTGYASAGVISQAPATGDAIVALFANGSSANLRHVRGGSGIRIEDGGTTLANLQCATVNCNSLVSVGGVYGGSDERLKTNWRNVKPDFVTKLAKIKSGVYDRVDRKQTQMGVSAQSLRRLAPEAVQRDTKGFLAVDYGQAALVSCVELAKVVVELQAEIAKLKTKG